MNTINCNEGFEQRQLDFIQRVGAIGYWEYDPATQTMRLTEAALALLSPISAKLQQGRCSFMAVLPEKERQRLRAALSQSLKERLSFTIELELAGDEGSVARLVLRGAPLQTAPGGLLMAGTLRDITLEKQRDAEHEKVITQLQALLDVLPQGVSVVGKDLHLMLWNRRFYEILNFPQSMVFRGAQFEDFIRFNALRGDYGPGSAQTQVQAIVARAREFLPHRFERQLPGGRTVLVEGLPFKSAGVVSGFVTTYTDITDQRHTEEQLTRQRDEMKTVIDNFPGGISLCNADLRFTTFNVGLMALLDFPPALFAKGWVDFEDLVRFNVARGEYGPGDPEQQVQTSMERARNFQAHQFERARPNGRWLEIRGTPIPSGGFVSSYIDITDRKRIETELVRAKEIAEARREQVVQAHAELALKNQQLESLSVTDRLTGLFNRRKFDEVLAHECARALRAELPLSLMIVDIDHFKAVNDHYGHQIGDHVLVDIAQLLQQGVRKVDTVARWGGEEFVILCPATDLASACALADNIRCTIDSQDFAVVGRKTACFGVAQYRPDEAPDAMVKRADDALYRAKEEGRDKVCAG